MQWDASPNAGFTDAGVTPWLPLAPDADRVNVAAQAEDPDALLTLTRRLIEVRRSHPVLALGAFESFGATPDGTYAFRRVGTDGSVTVALNLTDAPARIAGVRAGRVLIGTRRDRDGEAVAADLELAPNEALVIEEG
jgi:alpha-glucosidase